MSIAKMFELYKEAGFALIAVGSLTFVIVYFMRILDKFRVLIDNHLDSQTVAFTDLSMTLNNLIQTVENSQKNNERCYDLLQDLLIQWGQKE